MQIGLNVTFRGSLSYMSSCLRAADEDPAFAFGPDGKMLLARTATGYRAAICLMNEPEKQPTK